MEYTQKSPIELSKYIEDYHTSVKKEFEIVLTDIYNNEINKYSDIIEHIVRLPFVQAIVEENKRLKEQVTKLQQNLDVDNNETTHVVLEISDKPVTQTYQNMDDVILNHADSDDSDTELSGEDDEDEEDTIQPTFPTHVVEPRHEEDEEPSADEDEEDQEDEEPSADEEEEELEYTEEEIAYNKVDDVMFNKKCLNTDMKNNVKLIEAEEEEEEDQEDEEPSADEEEEDQEDEDEEPSADEDEEPSADEDEEPSADEEEETEVIELEIDDITYYCDGEENGNIYADDNGEVGDIVGELKDGEAIFH